MAVNLHSGIDCETPYDMRIWDPNGRSFGWNVGHVLGTDDFEELFQHWRPYLPPDGDSWDVGPVVFALNLMVLRK